MRAYLAATLFAIGILAAPAMPQQPRPVPKANAAHIVRLIDALDSATFADRERANRELLALEGAALEPLRNALGKGRSVEFTRRANGILDALAIHEPGGDVVNGLKVRLTADRTTLKAGESIKLITTLCNMTDKPLNVMVGYTFCGNYFECGYALRRAQFVQGKPTPDVVPNCQAGFCGTGAGPMYVTLPAKSTVKFETPAALAPQQAVYTLGMHKYFTIEGTRTIDDLRMVLDVAGNQPRPARPGMKGEGVRPTDEDAPFWTGTIRSNDLRLKITP